MKFCDGHWQKLRDAIADRGLDIYVARGNKAVTAKVADAIERGALTLENFDPLVGAHNRIVLHAINAAGLAVLANNDDGTERCPICYLTEWHKASCTVPNCAQDFESWITFAANGSRQTLEQLLQQQPTEAKQ